MPNPPFRSAGVLMLLGVAVSACEDLPSAPSTSGQPGARVARVGSEAVTGFAYGRGEAPFTCYASDRVSESPATYRYTHFSVDFPKSAQDPDGAMMIYRYRLLRSDGNGEPLGAANCRIPKTEEAVRIMNRRLRVEEQRTAPVPGGKNGSDISISSSSCPTTGCPLEGIIAYGYRSSPSYPYTNSTGTTGCWYSCGWGASYWDGGTGSTWDPYTPNMPGEPCRTNDPFLGDPAVNQGFDELWKASNPSANIVHRVEQIGWIVKTATGYRIQPFATGNFCGWDGVAPWPEEGPDAIAGFIHTHPYTVGESIIGCDPNTGGATVEEYKGTPSDVDRSTSVQLGQALGRGEPLAGVILDANGIRVFKGTDAASDVSVDRCGY